MTDLLSSLKKAAREAGQIILSAHGQSDAAGHPEPVPSASPEDSRAEKEGHANFVTKYDSQVQEYLIAALSRLLPEASFLGEEDGRSQFLDAYRTGYTFVIDPIDGTSDFMKQYFPYVTSIGLLRDGDPYLGVVYSPLSGQMFSAVRGQGAFENDRPIRTSPDPLSLSLVIMGTAPYRAELSGKAFAMGAEYMPHCIDIRRGGSAAYDLCMVASGRIGYYYEPSVCLYDYAAGACIAMEAGAVVTDLSGEKLSFTGDTSIAAAGAGVARAPYLPKDLLGRSWMDF